jgi:predicted O-methyltransferase YrrM
MSPQFSRDYTTGFESKWLELLGQFAGKPNAMAIEIGCLEGRSSLWFLENILTADTSRLMCIDPQFAPAFEQNISRHRARVQMIRSTSRVALRDPALVFNSVDFIYIDGNHTAPFVLEDAILAFPLLAKGGVMIFDDYLLQSRWPHIPETMSKIAIDAFLAIYKSRLKLLHKDWQVAVEKTCLS